MTAGAKRGRLLLVKLVLLGWRIPVVLAVIGGYIAFLIYLPAAPTVSVVNARSEQVSFTVVVPEMVRIRLAGYGMRGETAARGSTAAAHRPRAAAQRPGGAGTAPTAQARAAAPRRLVCLGGLVEFTAGTRVIFRRFGEGPIRVVLDRFDDRPVAQFTGQPGPVPAEFRRASWLLLEQSEDCDGEAQTRLPIHGIVEIGDEQRPQTSLEEPSSAPLFSGTVQVYGRTIDIGILFDDRRSRLYPVSEMAIPPGARVIEAPSVGGQAGTTLWSGFARLDTYTTAFQIDLTTEATRLALYRPGAGLEPEIINVGLFAQLTNDPNLVSLQVAFRASPRAVPGNGWLGRPLRRPQPWPCRGRGVTGKARGKWVLSGQRGGVGDPRTPRGTGSRVRRGSRRHRRARRASSADRRRRARSRGQLAEHDDRLRTKARSASDSGAQRSTMKPRGRTTGTPSARSRDGSPGRSPCPERRGARRPPCAP